MRGLTRALVFAALAPLGSLTSGCGCKAMLATELRPGRDVTLHVGESTQLEYRVGGCGPMRTVEMRYYTIDTAVVRVDSLSGRVTGRAVGDAVVALTSPGSGAPDPTQRTLSGWEQVQVHVR